MLKSQITADFTFTQTDSCVPYLATMVDVSTSGSPIVFRQWIIDGVPFSNSNSSITEGFLTAGCHEICLVVSNSSNQTDTLCQPDLFCGYAPPDAQIGVQPGQGLIGCEPFFVQFQDASIQGTGNIVSWLWNYGDGTSDTITNAGDIPSHYFDYNSNPNFNPYNVTLQIVDEHGCSDVVVETDYIEVREQPDISFDFSMDSNCNLPADISINNTSPNQAGTTYQWNFGDGPTIITGDNPTHTYFTYGSFDITVIAIDNVTLCSDTLFVPDAVILEPGFTFDYDVIEGCGPTQVDFSFDPPAGVIGWTLNFGDGSPVVADVTDVSHIYQPAINCYTPILTVIYNNSGFICTEVIPGADCIDINFIPNVNYNLSNNISCTVPHIVTFDGFSSIPNADYFWTIGDVMAYSADTTIVFNDFGVYPVSLNVVTADGCTAAYATDTIFISELEANFGYFGEDFCAPDSITLLPFSNSLGTIVSYDWTIFTNPPVTSTMQNPQIQLDSGTYFVELEITDSYGCTDVVTGAVQLGIEVDVEFSATPLNVCAEIPIDFFDSTSLADTWFWQFGDGGTDTAQFPTYSYTDTGLFTVILTTSYLGCVSSDTISDYIYISAPIAGMITQLNCDSPLTVSVIDTSLAATSIFYDFGDPNRTDDTTSIRDPFWTYDSSGVYVITQTVYNSNTDCFDQRRDSIFIYLPEANFTLDPLIGCPGMQVNTFDLSRDAVAWEWIAPGGDIDDPDAQNTFITYDDSGVYSNIQLVITDPNGCTDTLVSPDSIYVTEVIPDFSLMPNSGCTPLTVFFTDSSTSTYATIEDWIWDFGDGSPLIVGTDTASHTFFDPGLFDIQLTVTDSLGCVDSVSIPAAVLSSFPDATFDYNVDVYTDNISEGDIIDTIACVGQDITFFIIDTNLTHLIYDWDFGDGTGSSADSLPTYSYGQEGLFEVCVTLIDTFGCTDSYCKNVLIANPVADFIGDPTFQSCPTLNTNFTNNSLNAVTYFWDFGNGNSSTARNPSNPYASAGVYDVGLYIVGGSGCVDSLLYDDYITVEGPRGDFTFEPDQGCAPLDVTFTATGEDVYLFTLLFGDLSSYAEINSGNDSLVYTYTYQDSSGVYVPKLRVDDGLGCDVVIFGDTIVVEALIFDFIAEDTVVCDSSSLCFDIEIFNTSGNINNLNWTFQGGDIQSSDNFTPCVTFSDPGSFDVTLSMDNGFCQDTITKAGFVSVVNTPTAGFTADPIEGCLPLTVNLNDTSILIPAYLDNQNQIPLSIDIDSLNWNFGDGTVNLTNNPTPVHTYNTADTFNLSLVTVSDFGCRDSAEVEVIVHPVPDMEIIETPITCAGQDIFLQAFDNNNLPNVNYQWSPPGVVQCDTCLSTLANPITTTTFQLNAITDFGCQNSTSTLVEVFPLPPPTLQATPDTIVCWGEGINLIVTDNQNLGPGAYVWDTTRAGLTSYMNIQNPIANPTETTTYVVTVTNSFGCATVDSITVDVVGGNIAGPDRTICRGDSVLLTVDGGVNVQWFPGNFLSCVLCDSVYAFPQSTFTYQLRATLPLGCEVSDEITISVLDIDQVNAGDDLFICLGDSVQIEAIGVGDITWTPASGLNNPNILNPMASPSTPTTYQMTAVNDLCIITDEVVVTPVTVADIFAEGAIGCPGDTVQLSAGGIATDFSWTPTTNLINPDSKTPKAIVDKDRLYTVTGTLGNCDVDEVSVEVVAYDLPNINALDIYPHFEGQTVTLNTNAEGEGPFTYEWWPAIGLSCTDCPSPVVNTQSDSAQTKYYVRVSDGNECVNIDSVLLQPEPECSEDFIAVPNGFSPNGDGENDELYVRGNLISVINVFRIFDRWGRLVFETNDIKQGWDGTYRGEPLNPAVFVYYVEAPCGLDGRTVLFKKGNVTLIR